MLPTFQEQLKMDLENVFLNEKSEFTGVHTIDGIKYNDVIVDYALSSKPKGYKPLSYRDMDGGTFNNQAVIFAKSDTFPEPVQDSKIILDNNCYTIIQIKRYSGMYEILLEGADS